MNDYSTYTDLELLPLIREHKPIRDKAFSVLYQRYSKQLYAYCLFHVDDRKQADDIIQEVWTVFLHSVKHNKKFDSVWSYLMGTARYLKNKHFVEDKIETAMFLNVDNQQLEKFSSSFNFLRVLENNELTIMLNIAINSLEDIYKEVFIYKKYNELSYEQIAEITGETVDCLRHRFLRANRMLQVILKPYINELSK